MNSRKWSWFAIGWQMFYAWTMGLMVYQFGCLIAYGTFGFWTLIAVLILCWYLYMIFKPMPSSEKSVRNTIKPAGAKA